MAQFAKPPTATAGTHVGTSSHPSCYTFHLNPGLWPGRAVQDDPRLLDPVHTWQTPKKFLVPGFGSAYIQPLQPFGSKSLDGISLSLLLSVNLLFIIKINMLYYIIIKINILNPERKKKATVSTLEAPTCRAISRVYKP